MLRLPDRTLALLTVWFLAMGTLLLLIAAGFWLPEHHKVASQQTATGTITEFVPQIDATGHILFYPHIRFRTPDGALHEFMGLDGTNPVPFTTGGSVPVLYPAGRPDAARVGTASKAYPVAYILGWIGIILFDLGGFFWIAQFRRKRKALRERKR